MKDLFIQTSKTHESELAANINFDLVGSTLKYSVQGQKLTAPIHIKVKDDGTGKHASCLEIPQVYGFGETIDESLSMLEREIISLYTDIQEDVPLSTEYQILKIHLDALFANEK